MSQRDATDSAVTPKRPKPKGSPKPNDQGLWLRMGGASIKIPSESKQLPEWLRSWIDYRAPWKGDLDTLWHKLQPFLSRVMGTDGFRLSRVERVLKQPAQVGDAAWSRDFSLWMTNFSSASDDPRDIHTLSQFVESNTFMAWFLLAYSDIWVSRDRDRKVLLKEAARTSWSADFLHMLGTIWEAFYGVMDYESRTAFGRAYISYILGLADLGVVMVQPYRGSGMMPLNDIVKSVLSERAQLQEPWRNASLFEATVIVAASTLTGARAVSASAGTVQDDVVMLVVHDDATASSLTGVHAVSASAGTVQDDVVMLVVHDDATASSLTGVHAVSASAGPVQTQQEEILEFDDDL